MASASYSGANFKISVHWRKSIHPLCRHLNIKECGKRWYLSIIVFYGEEKKDMSECWNSLCFVSIPVGIVLPSEISRMMFFSFSSTALENVWEASCVHKLTTFWVFLSLSHLQYEQWLKFLWVIQVYVPVVYSENTFIILIAAFFKLKFKVTFFFSVYMARKLSKFPLRSTITSITH